MSTFARPCLAVLVVAATLGATACGGGSTAVEPSPPAVTSPSPSASVDGRWRGEWQTDRSPELIGSFDVTFVQVGEDLSGRIRVNGSACISAGTIRGTARGDTVTFRVDRGKHSITYRGTTVHSVMSGTYSAVSCGEGKGSWTAIRTAG